jgi:hypothetical protein
METGSILELGIFVAEYDKREPWRTSSERCAIFKVSEDSSFMRLCSTTACVINSMHIS